MSKTEQSSNSGGPDRTPDWFRPEPSLFSKQGEVFIQRALFREKYFLETLPGPFGGYI